VLLGGAAAFFGWALVGWLTWPLRIRPRIVPYFARPLAEHGGETSRAFRRGRGLYREIIALDELATALGVTRLSAFGFAYDHYGQEVRWHAAAEGRRTVEALRHGLGAPLRAAPDVAGDLEALAAALRVAEERGIDWSLVLRLNRKDSLQAVSTLEGRQGSFW
jgi:hypothetical protein